MKAPPLRPLYILAAAVAAAAVARLAHTDILWVEEAYPMAAAAEVLRGKALYRDVWFDKPPLYALVYGLWGADTGVPLRLAGALFIGLAAWVAYRFARDLWGPREGAAAGALTAFYLTFGTASAVIALAPDLLMIVPQLAAVWLAWKGRAFWAGAMAGIALLVNVKGWFVLAACALWAGRQPGPLLAGFALPNALAAAALGLTGAWSAYWQQVWVWGWGYSRDTFLRNPLDEGALRTLNWAGFHATLVVSAVWLARSDRGAETKRMIAWAAISLMAVAAGWRFFPRYYLQLLPAAVLMGARGLARMPRAGAAAAALLLLIPLARFGPRYLALGTDLVHGRVHEWTDVTMNQQSRDAAQLIRGLARPGDTLLVWGYRPDVYVYSGLPAATRFLDSQPLTGVIADRHLTNARPTFPEWAARNREELKRSRPIIIADGLGPYNPPLAIERFGDLREWLGQYEVAGMPRGFIIYRLIRRATPEGASRERP